MRDRMRWAAVVVGVVVGLAVGIGAYTFVYARGASYLGNDPAACANCHVMREQFVGWTRSPHRAAATCNDCHTPHALVPKYLVKARNGFWHSFYFTTGRFEEPIRITPVNRAVTQAACRGCHERIVAAIDAGAHGDRQLDCIRCHRNVGHAH